MSKLINFFFSFDKLMKEGLVRAFYWLALIYFALEFSAQFLDAIRLDWFAAVFELIHFPVKILFAVVGLRLAAELAIALFRINDNLSPDGGKSETADIDPVAEARHAAEVAAKRAQEATKTAVDRTSAATRSATDRSKSVAHELKEDLSSKVKPQVRPVKKSTTVKTVEAKPAKAAKAAKVSKAAPKKAAVKTAAVKKSPAKKTTVTRKTDAKKSTVKKTGSKLKRKPGMKLDGTPRKKPGPKPK